MADARKALVEFFAEMGMPGMFGLREKAADALIAKAREPGGKEWLLTQFTKALELATYSVEIPPKSTG